MGKQHFAQRILVVDDNSNAAELVAQLLKLHGHQVDFACNGALAAANRLAPGVVFFDIGMPDMDGYQIASALRQSDKCSSARIVALTAWGNGKTRVKANASGLNRILSNRHVKRADERIGKAALRSVMPALLVRSSCFNVRLSGAFAGGCFERINRGG
jgi:CheY-like chemotaxis protein